MFAASFVAIRLQSSSLLLKAMTMHLPCLKTNSHDLVFSCAAMEGNAQ
jgi:hypothetical protein